MTISGPLRLRFIAPLAILGVVAVVAAVQAGPVTNSATPGQPPYTKLGIYRKVLSIVDASGSALELGNNGQDIAATGNINLTPGDGTAVAANSVQVVAGGGVADLYVSGDLCLYDHSSGTPTCKHQWPTSGASSLWQAGTGNYSGAYTFIKPVDGATGTPGVTTTLPVTMAGFGMADIFAANRNPAGQAVQFSGTRGNLSAANGATIEGTLNVVTGGVPREVWHRPYSASVQDGTRSCNNSISGLCVGGDVPGTGCNDNTPCTGGGLCQLSNVGAACTTDAQCNNGGQCYPNVVPFNSPGDGADVRLPGEEYGVDADSIMGNQATIEPASSCPDDLGFTLPSGYNSTTKPHVACLCFYTRFYLQSGAFDYYGQVDSQPRKRCMALANYY